MPPSIILVLSSLSVILLIIYVPAACSQDETNHSKKCYRATHAFYGIRMLPTEWFCHAKSSNMSQTLIRESRSSTVQFSSRKQIGGLSDENKRNDVADLMALVAPVACSRIRWWRCVALCIGSKDGSRHQEACTILMDAIDLMLIAIVSCVLVYDYRTRKRAALPPNRSDVTDSGNSSQVFFCNVCMERKRVEKSFKIQDCGHEFCSECIIEHVKVKIGENSTIVWCMEVGCQSQIYLESCQRILNAELLEKWSMMISESLILPSQKFYCPFKNCSALLWDDTEGREVIREAECPYCWRLFCAQCKVGWHAGMSCSEFQTMRNWLAGKDEVMMKDMANQKNWQRCPRCKFYVDKVSGCLQITCRCGYQFCYRCGSSWTPKHYQCKLKRQTGQMS
ncbi:uncharacterized protein LOC116263893 isoform X1 [Nymphaea colorata]|nr:uncharacterized protein LOC116263893 isoform X1 [Nymphaea colorata]